MISLFKVMMSGTAGVSVEDVLDSGQIAQGPIVDKFEKELSIEVRNPNIVTVNSCTSAIHLALAVLKEKENLDNDTEVLTTPVTCFATNAPIIHNGFKIKWCDINPDTLNIDTEDVISKMTEKTRILMYVDWGGYPLDYEYVEYLKYYYLEKFGKELFVIEDAAHAFGSKWYTHPVGSRRRHFTCFSFQAIKHLTTGDGGMLVTPDKYYKQARLMRWFGLDRDNKVDFRACQDINHVGYKFHMNDIAAAIGLENLKIVHANIKKQQENTKVIEEYVNNPIVRFLKHDRFVESSCWLNTIYVDNQEEFSLYMAEAGIQTNKVHVRNDKLSCFSKFDVGGLPNLDKIDNKRVCIPNGWFLKDHEVDNIIRTINEYSP